MADEDYVPPSLGDAFDELADSLEELTTGQLSVCEEAAARILAEESVGWDPARSTARAALLTYEATERALKLRASGLSIGDTALEMGVPESRVRYLLTQVAKRFRERQWIIYSEVMATRLARSEEHVGKILELLKSADPHVRLAAHAELRKDLEALPKIFGVSNTTVNQLTMTNVQLGGSSGNELAVVRKQMMGVIESSPEARDAFMKMLEPELPPSTEKEPGMPDE